MHASNNNMWKKNILKINENELHYTRAAVCITRVKNNFFVLFASSPWKKTETQPSARRKNIAENNLIVF